MWRVSLISSLMEFLSYLFLRLRRNLPIEDQLDPPVTTLPATSTCMSDYVLVVHSTKVGGDIELNASSAHYMLEACKKGDQSLCEAFGIHPAALQTALIESLRESYPERAKPVGISPKGR